jgi:hypothetical protein
MVLGSDDLLGWAFFSNGIFSFGFGFILSLLSGRVILRASFDYLESTTQGPSRL